MEEKRIAVVSVIVEDRACVARVNEILSVFGSSVLGRIGLPCKERNVSIITLIVDAQSSVINAVTGQLGAVKGASAKTLMR